MCPPKTILGDEKKHDGLIVFGMYVLIFVHVYLDLPFVCKLCAEIHPKKTLPILTEMLHIYLVV